MSEKTGFVEKMEYLFNEAKHLEVYVPNLKGWYRVTPNDFRSWDGKRRIQGEEYEGPLYAYGTNRKVPLKNTGKIIPSEILNQRNAISQKIR